MRKRLVESSVASKLRSLKRVNLSGELPLAIFIFRRDLRLFDNTALLACAKSFRVAPIFIFTPEQLQKNPFKSSNCVQFMVESLGDLEKQVEEEGGRFLTFFGEVEAVLGSLIGKFHPKAVFFNRDYTPYAVARDQKIASLCERLKVEVQSFDDLLLMGDLSLRTGGGTPYSVFTPFGNRLADLPKRKPDFGKVGEWADLEDPPMLLENFKESLLKMDVYRENEKLAVRGGREVGLGLLKKACEKLKNYEKSRNDLSDPNGTTMLSAHNKFGTLSIREVYYSLASAFGAGSCLVKQLYWRDFFYYLGTFYPEVYDGVPIPSKSRYKDVKWRYDGGDFGRWARGETGFPLVDAGIRQLNSTGFMHNRCRMIVAMFLTKDLQIDWRWGEKHFAQYLVDYDRAQNLGGWTWSAGTGADGSPFLRVFNPWTQQKKFDPECEYIKRWIPELAKVKPEDIHNWAEKWEKHKGVYFKPMVDHQEAKQLALEAYGEKGKKAKGGDKEEEE